MDKVSYALGLSLGSNLANSGVKDLNINDLKQGINDVLEGKQPAIPFDEAQEILNKYFEEIRSNAFQKNISQGESYLAENAKRTEVTTTDSGLQYEILKKGEGKVPTATDTVKVHYHGTLLNGTVFDSSVQRGEPATFGVTQVIQGWVEALQLMPVGSKWKLSIPYQLAYGERGAGQSIEPFSTLIFEVELIDIV